MNDDEKEQYERNLRSIRNESRTAAMFRFQIDRLEREVEQILIRQAQNPWRHYSEKEDPHPHFVAISLLRERMIEWIVFGNPLDGSQAGFAVESKGEEMARAAMKIVVSGELLPDGFWIGAQTISLITEGMRRYTDLIARDEEKR